MRPKQPPAEAALPPVAEVPTELLDPSLWPSTDALTVARHDWLDEVEATGRRVPPALFWEARVWSVQSVSHRWLGGPR